MVDSHLGSSTYYDARSSPSLEPRSSPSLEPRSSPSLEPRSSPSLEPRSSPNFEPRTSSSLDLRSRTVSESTVGTVYSSYHGRYLSAQTRRDLYPREVSGDSGFHSSGTSRGNSPPMSDCETGVDYLAALDLRCSSRAKLARSPPAAMPKIPHQGTFNDHENRSRFEGTLYCNL